MKFLVVYDSVYGNTEKVAREVAAVLGPAPAVGLAKAADVKPEQLQGLELLIVGAPTQGFRPLPSIRLFLEGLPDAGLKDVKVAAFDTRIAGKEAAKGARLVAKVGGYAAKRIADTLQKKGGILIVPPEGFAVNASEGPLATGELEHAKTWAKTVSSVLKSK